MADTTINVRIATREADELLKRIAEISDFAGLDRDRFIAWCGDTCRAYLAANWDLFDGLMAESRRRGSG